ncbi:heavy-metal-associated domain-containing protein [Ichthyenterobacterium magnum]|uniref:Copper chaperone CopZ n=1 Tax=Ichthyenterobacterium magnum TaxID=1230530 RepID=A0A420DER4_9FLAO|nr:heavy-metal-associated domain-containing protein [Ichthyenterobacterium magnum]RKE90794.1 copper chaperone CopZ [Ichthyenterobacterium magnum]
MKTTLNIQNLKCGGCANTIITRLEDLKHINNVIVDNDNHSVSFSYETENDYDEAKALLSKLGYPAEGELNPITKKAKSFVSCAVGRINS